MKWKAPAAGVVGLALLLTLPFLVQRIAAEPAASARPNFVFVLTDDQSMGMLETMPYLSRKPGGSWIEFTNAFVNVPFCCPSRSNILTGQYAHHHGVNTSNGGLLDDSSTIATWLDDAGYRTGLVGKYLNGYPFSSKPENYVAPGWDYWAAFDGVDHYDYRLNENGTTVAYGRDEEDYSTDVLYRKAIEFLDDTTPDEPFLLYFSTHAPHAVNTPAPRHEGHYDRLRIDYSPNFNEEDVSDKPAWIRALPVRPQGSMTDDQRRAAETLLAVDEAIRGIMRKLRETEQLDNTVIVFMTDNGFSFGSHRWIQKLCAYDECVRTPLLIRYPDSGANRTESRLVSNVDIAPTFAELAQASPGNQIDGHSLVPLLTGDATTWRSSLLLQHQGLSTAGESPTFWAVRTDEWKYVELRTGEKELYDLRNDPFELDNVVTDPAHASVVASLAAELRQLRSG
jgi:arylsulfatase A-like enzyme